MSELNRVRDLGCAVAPSLCLCKPRLSDAHASAPCKSVVPKLWYAKAFKVVRETLLFFYTKRIHFVFTYRLLLINSCIFVCFPC